MNSSQNYRLALHKALNVSNTAFFYFTFNIITSTITNIHVKFFTQVIPVCGREVNNLPKVTT